jgi:hypothetical protein
MKANEFTASASKRLEKCIYDRPSAKIQRVSPRQDSTRCFGRGFVFGLCDNIRSFFAGANIAVFLRVRNRSFARTLVDGI